MSLAKKVSSHDGWWSKDHPRQIGRLTYSYTRNLAAYREPWFMPQPSGKQEESSSLRQDSFRWPISNSMAVFKEAPCCWLTVRGKNFPCEILTGCGCADRTPEPYSLLWTINKITEEALAPLDTPHPAILPLNGCLSLTKVIETEDGSGERALTFFFFPILESTLLRSAQVFWK